MKTYAKLVFKHPIEFMKVQVPIFFKANAISLDYQISLLKKPKTYLMRIHNIILKIL